MHETEKNLLLPNPREVYSGDGRLIGELWRQQGTQVERERRKTCGTVPLLRSMSSIRLPHWSYGFASLKKTLSKGELIYMSLVLTVRLYHGQQLWDVLCSASVRWGTNGLFHKQLHRKETFERGQRRKGTTGFQKHLPDLKVDAEGAIIFHLWHKLWANWGKLHWVSVRRMERRNKFLLLLFLP